jgi:toxin YoeB
MTYRLDFTKKTQEDIAFHKRSGNKNVLSKIAIILYELTEHPFTGSGKPEPLKHNLSGMWSRRINREHRLVYEVFKTAVVVLQAKGHYDK